MIASDETTMQTYLEKVLAAIGMDMEEFMETSNRLSEDPAFIAA
jgi:hypothetical protein